MLCWWYFVDHQQLETANQVVNEFDVRNKLFVVTGGSSGIGKETARALVDGGAQVIVASQSRERGDAAVREMNSCAGRESGTTCAAAGGGGGGTATFELLDLGSFTSIQTFVKRLRSTRKQVVDGIVLNAGVIAPTFDTTVDGIERTLQINHLGHLDLLQQLLQHDHIQGPIVSLSSYQPARHADKDVLHFEQHNWPFFLPGAYGVAKQASIRTGREFTQRYRTTTATSSKTSFKYFSVHPGWCATDLGLKRARNTMASMLEVYGAKLWWSFASHFVRVKTVSEAASTSLRCLLDPSLSSGFYSDGKRGLWPREEDNTMDKKERRKKDVMTWEKSMALIQSAKRGRWKRSKKKKAETSNGNEEGKEDNVSSSSPSYNIVSVSLFSILFHLGSYFCLFTFVGRLNFSRFGFQKINKKSTDPWILGREKRRVWTSAVVDALYAVLMFRYGLLDSSSLGGGGGLGTSVSLFLFWTVFITLWTDVHFYITHRLLHMIPGCYKYVHYAHHESHNPNVWSSLSFHPVEAAVFFSAYLVVLKVQMPLIMFIGFKIGMVSFHDERNPHSYIIPRDNATRIYSICFL